MRSHSFLVRPAGHAYKHMPDVYQHHAALEILLLHRFSQAMPIFARGFAGADGQKQSGKTMKLRRTPGEARIGLTTALPQGSMSSSAEWTFVVVDAAARRERMRTLIDQSLPRA